MDKSGKAPIMGRITVGRSIAQFSCKLSCNPDLWSPRESRMNSMVDAANYMVDKGWSFQQAYSSAYGGKPVIHWIFYKDAENMEKAREGIMTKTEYQKK